MHLAGPARRVAAALVDTAVALILLFLLARLVGPWFSGRARLMLLVGHPESVWKGLVPMILGYLGRYTYTLPLVLAVVSLPEALASAGPGKALLGLRVRGADGEPPRAGRRIARWALKSSGASLMLAALGVAWWPLAVAALAASALVIAGGLGILGSERAALHDRLTRTRVACRG